MLGWIFKKNTSTDTVADPPVPVAPARTLPTEPAFATDWASEMQAAQGSAEALLALARRPGVPVDVQQAAIEGVTDEAALKRAEREWRGQDRRLHRLVKQRHLAQVAQREARERATQLLAAAEALQGESPIPTNRLVELDRGWQSLDLAWLEPEQVARYTALRDRLTALTRERGDESLRLQRWAEEARCSGDALMQAMTEAATGSTTRDPLAAAATAARAAAESAPELDAAQAPLAALQAVLALAQAFGSHLTLMDALMAATGPAVADRLADWDARLPLADARLGALLSQQVTNWRSARDAERSGRRSAQRMDKRDRQRASSLALDDTLTRALDAGEAALAEGHLADAHRHLLAIDEGLAGTAAPAALASRIGQLQADVARLKGWQHWAGGVARDELVRQAEALAEVSLRDPATRSVKLSVRQQAEVIDEMRARWKELDRLGGATSRALWQRFDSALKTAWQPVAEHQARQREAREQNLQARVALIEVLDAVRLPADDDPAPPDWRAIAAALEQSRGEWRKLGPLEYTVPHQARDGLQQRLEAATARLESPLTAARRVAQAARERLVARARALAEQAVAGTAGRDSIDRVRELQAEWQQQAKTLPLARAAESALWADFKAALDAVYGAREAAFQARDAQFKAGAAERLTLIERLEGLDPDAPAAALKRTLAELDAQWQHAAPPPRDEVAALDSRWRTARTRWLDHLAGSARRAWHAQCDLLSARLAMCDAADDHADANAAHSALLAQWPDLPALAPAWSEALKRRLGVAQGSAAAGGRAATDALMLQLEMAAGLASPAAHDAARRELKLRALKSTLEGRQNATAAGPAKLLADLLEHGPLDAWQRLRLAAIVDGLRRGEPLP